MINPDTLNIGQIFLHTAFDGKQEYYMLSCVGYEKGNLKYSLISLEQGDRWTSESKKSMIDTFGYCDPEFQLVNKKIQLVD